MRIGFRTPPSLQVTPNQSEPAFSSAFATSGPPWPYPFPFTIERILRGVLRFSSGGFTYFRMAWRLYVKAERETSAQTGRLTSLWGLICIDRFAVILPFDRFAVMLPVVAMGLPERKYSVRHSCWAYRRPHWLPPERQHPPALQAEGLSDPQPPSKAQRLVLVTTSLLYFLTGSVPAPPALSPSHPSEGTL